MRWPSGREHRSRERGGAEGQPRPGRGVNARIAKTRFDVWQLLAAPSRAIGFSCTPGGPRAPELGCKARLLMRTVTLPKLRMLLQL